MSLQVPLEDVERVVSAAEAISGDHNKAAEWLHQPLSAFGHKTPLQLIAQGRTDAVIKYLDSVASGYVG